MHIEKKPGRDVRKILLDGELLETTEALALKLSHNFDFPRRIIEEISLIISGQAIKFLDIGLEDRAFSHAALYGTHGFGKDFTWKIAMTSGIFPFGATLHAARLDNVTEAALIGTITESEIVPPPTISQRIIFVGEYSTFMKGLNADKLAANMRSLLGTGEYHRKLAKVVGLKEIVNDSTDKRRHRLMDELEKYKKLGMSIDVNTGMIHVRTSTSWIISSARFGSDLVYGKPLLSLGGVDRYRWRSYLPTREERIRVTSEVGSLPSTSIQTAEIETVNEAWRILYTSLRKLTSGKSIEVPKDEASYQIRRKIWNETQKEILDLFPDMNEVYEDQLLTLSARAEFRRLMYQHAALKQFEREPGHDFSEPMKFRIDYEEDGEFAKQLWLNEYVPSIMNVIDDIMQRKSKRSKRTSKSVKGEKIVLKQLEEGSKTRKELLKCTRKAGIKDTLIDNVVLPSLVEQGLICKPTDYKVYILKDCGMCKFRDSCTSLTRDLIKKSL